VGVVDEAVDEGGGGHGVAQDLAPGVEAAVAGDDDRAAFVAAGDQGEEEVGGLALEREVADLVDDQELVALEAFEFVVEGVAVLGGLEAVDPLLGGGPRDAVPRLAGLERERDREEASMDVKSRFRGCGRGGAWARLRAVGFGLRGGGRGGERRSA